MIEFLIYMILLDYESKWSKQRKRERKKKNRWIYSVREMGGDAQQYVYNDTNRII